MLLLSELFQLTVAPVPELSLIQVVLIGLIELVYDSEHPDRLLPNAGKAYDPDESET